jgi:hypothetical protein
MLRPLALALLAVAGLRGCVVYEYEHEFWLDTDGSGSVYVTGRPELWESFKGMEGLAAAGPEDQKAKVRHLFEEAGLVVNRVTRTHRRGRPYLFVSADFDEVNRLEHTRAFPDLALTLRPEGERIVLRGTWRCPPLRGLVASDRDGLMAVRFHVPSKVYEHKNASEGVERGNILSWQQPLADALRGSPLEFGARMDERSILLSTVSLFAGAIVAAVALLGAMFYWVIRKGRRELRAQDGSPPSADL